MKKKVIIITSAVAGTLLIGGGLWFALSGSSASDSDNIVYVTSVETLTSYSNANGVLNRFAGVVETQEKLEIQPDSEKTIKEIFVEEGDEVEVGTPLFTYDTESDKENLEKAKLELERIDNSIANKTSEIAVLEKEKKNASSDEKLDYTIQIQSAQMELKQSEYEKKSKQVEIQKLEESIENAEVTSELAGVVKSINEGTSQESYYYGESQAFMEIIAMGDFRIKGKINEQNMGSIIPGQEVIVHSRIDDSVTWQGVMGEVDMQNPGNDSAEMYYYSGDSTTQTNSYPFYVELENSDGLMLGQHVYIEADYGQEEEKKGIWLDEYLIASEDGETYVWADNGKGRLEKREVVLGAYDENLCQFEIVKGLELEDMITFPEDGLEEGLPTASGENGQMGQSNPQISEDMMMEGEMSEDDMWDGELLGDEISEDGLLDGEMIEGEGSEDGLLDGKMIEGGVSEDGVLDGELPDDEVPAVGAANLITGTGDEV